MMIANNIPVRISEEAAQFIEEMGLQEPFHACSTTFPYIFGA